MIQFDNIKTYNVIPAILGIRNAFQSWDKNDSIMEEKIIGPIDLKLAQKLLASGHDSHTKFMRQIMVSMDINAPLIFPKKSSILIK